MFKNWFTPIRLKWLGLALVMTGLIGNVWLIGSFRTVRAADCDDNAVIRCGISDEAALQQKCAQNVGNTQGIFQAFGIGDCSGALNGLVIGQVTSDNKVFIQNANGGYDLVATDAITAGRQRIASSDTPIAGGAAYQRPPSESFVSSPLAALVKMDGSKFLYAVIMSCGNPVNATPLAPPPQQPPAQPPKQPTPPPPSYEIQKTDRLHAQDPWGEEVIAKPKDYVMFQLLVKNTGQTALDGTVVTDALPAGLTYVKDSLFVDGSQQKGVDITKTGVTLAKFAPGQTVTITFEATANDIDACNNNPLTNTGNMQPPNLTPKSDTAIVRICRPTTKIVKIVKRIVKKTPPPPPTKVLVDTGPGSMAGFFLLSTVGGALLYQVRLRRKL